MTELADILDTLESHIAGLKEKGFRRVPVDRPIGESTRPARSVSSPAKSPTSLAAPSAAVRNDPRPASPPPPSPAAELRTLRAKRMAECDDPIEVQGEHILLVLEPSELNDSAGTLLAEMLRAAGFEIEGDPIPFDPTGNIPPVTLTLGESAMKALSPLPMGLAMVRGKWLDSPHGHILPTYAPSYCLGNRAGKKAVWTDLQTLLDKLALDIPEWTLTKVRKQR